MSNNVNQLTEFEKYLYFRQEQQLINERIHIKKLNSLQGQQKLRVQNCIQQNHSQSLKKIKTDSQNQDIRQSTKQENQRIIIDQYQPQQHQIQEFSPQEVPQIPDFELNFDNQIYTEQDEKQLKKFRKLFTTSKWNQQYTKEKNTRLQEKLDGQEILQYKFFVAKQKNSLPFTQTHQAQKNDFNFDQKKHIQRIQSAKSGGMRKQQWEIQDKIELENYRDKFPKKSEKDKQDLWNKITKKVDEDTEKHIDRIYCNYVKNCPPEDDEAIKNQISLKPQFKKNKEYLHFKQQKPQSLKETNQSLSKPSEMIPFPDWLETNQLFINLKNSENFSMEKKILAVCKIQSYKRDTFGKRLVALFLQKMPLFKLMPLDLLENIGGRIATRKYDDGEYVCRINDAGDCMYIIYKGTVEVYVRQGKVAEMNAGDMLGKRAIETGEKRTADLKAKGETHLLCLTAMDYQQCLLKAMEKEKKFIREFLLAIPFFAQHFKLDKIEQVCDHIKGKFLAPKEPLFTFNEETDNMYIVKDGELSQIKYVNLEYINKFPHLDEEGRQKWRKLLVQKEVTYTIKYKKNDILGYIDLIIPNEKSIRTEEIKATTDCFVLYINKTDFANIFDYEDSEIFKEYHKRIYPISYEELVKKVYNEETKYKESRKYLQDIFFNHLKSYSDIQLTQVSKKIMPILTKTLKERENNQIEKFPQKIYKAQLQILNSMYE